MNGSNQTATRYKNEPPGNPAARSWNYNYKRLFKKSSFQDEADQEAGSTSILEFSRAFRCSRTRYVRSATQSLALSNLLGPVNPIF
ncbi:hypothetical protein J28TS4_32470 [Paenibacillus lautus]|nr:hypothetical protein J28TS4_32470 [Paenibacillus lautus]